MLIKKNCLSISISLLFFYLVIYSSNIKLFNLNIFQNSYLIIDFFIIYISYEYLWSKKKLQININYLIFLYFLIIIIIGTLGYVFFFPEQLYLNSIKNIFASSFVYNLYIIFYYNFLDFKLKFDPLLNFSFYSLLFQILLIIFLIEKYKTLLNKKIICFLIAIIPLFYNFFISKDNTINNFILNPIYKIWIIFFSLILFDWLKKKNYEKINNFRNYILINLAIIFLLNININNSSTLFFTQSFLIFFFIILIFFNAANSTLDNSINKSIIIISYCIFIVHQPIFAFFRSFNLVEGNKVIMLIISIIVILFGTILFIVSKKIKKIKNTNYLIIMYISILIFSFGGIYTNGYANRLPLFLSEVLSPSERPWFKTKQNEKTCFARKDNFCTFNPNKKTNIFLVGDSVAGTLGEPLKNLSLKNNFSFTILTAPGCIFILNYNRVDLDKKKILEECDFKVQNKRVEVILNSSNPIVILAGRFPVYLHEEYFDNKEGKIEKNEKIKPFLDNSITNLNKIPEKKAREILFKKNFVKSIEYLLANQVKVLIVNTIPEPAVNLQNFIRSKIGITAFSTPKNLNEILYNNSYEVVKKRNSDFYKEISKINHENFQIINMDKIFCNIKEIGRCEVIYDNKFLYYDASHPTLFSSEKIVNKITEHILRIESK